MNIVEAFSSSYAEARTKFLDAAGHAGLELASYPHPLPGRDGELLALDVALDGAPGADKMLIVISACHGVEGYCGSGAQVFALRDQVLRAHFKAAGIAVLYLHAVNPYGFSHTRRVTHENVDLNRNFQDFSKPLPENPAYRELHALLLPENWPPDADNVAAMNEFLATRGVKALQAAVTVGQYEFADGLFYGGTAPTWSNQTLRRVLREYANGAHHLAWIDLHSGLGQTGHCERGFAGRSGDATAIARARAWWGGNGATPITTFGDAASVSAAPVGVMANAVYEECPDAEITAIAMEFGTQPLMQVLHALRAEQWLAMHPQAPPIQIKQALRDAFYVDTAQWKEAVVSEARQAVIQAFSA